MPRRRKSYPAELVARANALMAESADANGGKPGWTAVRKQLGEGAPALATLMGWWRTAQQQGTESRLSAAGRKGAQARSQGKVSAHVVEPPQDPADMTRLEFARWRMEDLTALLPRAAEGNPGAIPGIDKQLAHWRAVVEGERAKAAPDVDRIARLREALLAGGLISAEGELLPT